MGGDHDPTAIKKNVYIEGIANYRDQMHLRFTQNLRRGPIAPFIFCAFVFPAALWFGSSVGDEKMRDQKKAFQQKYKRPEALDRTE